MIMWKMRHEGSPNFVDGLTTQEIVNGVVEGFWEVTDEVKGPNDTVWRSLETHPQFAEAMSEYEPPPPPPPVDESKLDMNPLIDVALVLLIFFILTTSYQELRKKFPPPDAGRDSEIAGAAGFIEKETIKAKVEYDTGTAVIKLQDEVVAEADLKDKMKYWKEKTGTNKLSIDFDKRAPWKIFMALQDAAAEARINETIRIERE